MHHLKLHGEESADFTKRLTWLTKGFYAIKTTGASQKLIGFSFVYKVDNKFFYGAAIHPDYYHRQILNHAMMETSELAKYCYGIEHINFKLTVLTMNMSKQLSKGVIRMSKKSQKGYTDLVA